jgi:hypothetical protein
MSVENLRFVAVIVLVAIGSSVAQQQQPQEPKVHGFKARLCTMTNVPHSRAWDNCMAAGFGKPHPSHPSQPAAAPQQVTSAPQQVASAPQQVASAPQQVASAPQQVASAPQQVASAPQQVPPQPKLQEPIVNGTPVQVPVQTAVQPVQAPVQTAVQEKTCMEYMTTSSGEQTCLRFEK